MFTVAEKWNEAMAYTRVLVAVDNDGTNHKVCKRALEVVAGCDSKLVLLHVVEPPAPAVVPGGLGAIVPPQGPTDEAHTESVKAARKKLESVKAELGIRAAEIMVVESPLTKDTIHEAAQAVTADLVVVGSHGRHGLSLLLSASTASEFLKEAPCDLLAVRIEN